MALPKYEKKDPRPIAVTVRLSAKAVDALKKMAKDHNMSQADVIEYLIKQEFKTLETKRSK